MLVSNKLLGKRVGGLYKEKRVTSSKDSVKTSESSSFESTGPNESEKPIRFASATLGAKRHVCVFNSPDEEYR